MRLATPPNKLYSGNGQRYSPPSDTTPLAALQKAACGHLLYQYGVLRPGTVDEDDAARATLQTLVLHMQYAFEDDKKTCVIWKSGLHGHRDHDKRMAETPEPPEAALSLGYHDKATGRVFPPAGLAALVRLTSLKVHELDLCSHNFMAYREKLDPGTLVDAGRKGDSVKVPLYATFAAHMRETYGVPPEHAFPFYVIYASLAGRGRREDLVACLDAFDESLRAHEQLEGMAAYMENSMDRLESAGEAWRRAFATELAVLVHQAHVALPARGHCVMTVVPVARDEYEAYAERKLVPRALRLGASPAPSSSSEEEGEEAAEQPSAQEAEEGEADAGAPKQAAGGGEEEEEAEGEEAKEGEEETTTTTAAAAEEDADVPPAAAAQAKLVGKELPSLAAIEHKYGKHRCGSRKKKHRHHHHKKHHPQCTLNHRHDETCQPHHHHHQEQPQCVSYHEGLRGPHHRYELEFARMAKLPLSKCEDSELVARLALLSLMARTEDECGVRLAVARTMFSQPNDLMRRCKEASRTPIMRPEGPTRNPREWAAFLTRSYDYLDDAVADCGTAPSLGAIDAFNDEINRTVLRPEERANAPALRVKRYLSAYATDGDEERAILWEALDGCPARLEVRRALAQYVKDHPRIPPSTLQILLYLVSHAPPAPDC
jgi:hypothetical protein